jgi:hypothetical protein
MKQQGRSKWKSNGLKLGENKKTKFVIEKFIPNKTLQEITTFLTRNFGQKNPPYGFFSPMSNLTKMPFWTSQFGPSHFDWVF